MNTPSKTSRDAPGGQIGGHDHRLESINIPITEDLGLTLVEMPHQHEVITEVCSDDESESSKRTVREAGEEKGTIRREILRTR